MNNPFSRLKHFLPDKNDQKENHATECLAACLVFSENIRKMFIRFLFPTNSDSLLGAISQIEVETQQWTQGVGWFDLVLKRPNVFTVVVEIKVKAPEDGEQLKKYRSWLNEQSGQTNLFTLVRNPNPNLEQKDFSRRTWRDLHKHFQKEVEGGDLSDVDNSLLENLCEYLESEGIVTTYETKDLLNYAAGVKARNAITGIFNKVTDDLKVLDRNFEIFVDDRRNRWPQLKIQHPDWEKIFGKGENWKISIWFVVPGIWDAKEYSFYPEIELLNTEHKNKWEYIKSKLPQWEDILKGKQFNWKVCQYRDEQQDTPAREILSPPKRIISSNDDGLGGADFPVNEEELVNKLVDWVKRYAEVIKLLVDGGH